MCSWQVNHPSTMAVRTMTVSDAVGPQICSSSEFEEDGEMLAVGSFHTHRGNKRHYVEPQTAFVDTLARRRDVQDTSAQFSSVRCLPRCIYSEGGANRRDPLTNYLGSSKRMRLDGGPRSLPHWSFQPHNIHHTDTGGDSPSEAHVRSSPRASDLEYAKTVMVESQEARLEKQQQYLKEIINAMCLQMTTGDIARVDHAIESMRVQLAEDIEQLSPTPTLEQRAPPQHVLPPDVQEGPDQELYLYGRKYYPGLENELEGDKKPVNQLQDELMSLYQDAKTKGYVTPASE